MSSFFKMNGTTCMNKSLQDWDHIPRGKFSANFDLVSKLTCTKLLMPLFLHILGEVLAPLKSMAKFPASIVAGFHSFSLLVYADKVTAGAKLETTFWQCLLLCKWLLYFACEIMVEGFSVLVTLCWWTLVSFNMWIFCFCSCIVVLYVCGTFGSEKGL